MNPSGNTPTRPKLRADINWKLVVFSLLLLPLLIGLGHWQLQRAEEKRTIQESWQKQQALPPVALTEVRDDSDGTFRRVVMPGSFDSRHYWLLENQILRGQLGYEVIMPFRVAASDEVVLVNRGWVPAGAYREQLPQVETPADSLQITGTLVRPSQNRLINETPEATEWPIRLLQADLEVMSRQLRRVGYRADPYRYVLRLDPESRGALQVGWEPINLSPSTHTGYAVQWFGLALALVILTLIANTNIASVLFPRNRRGPSVNDNETER